MDLLKNLTNQPKTAKTAWNVKTEKMMDKITEAFRKA